MKYYSISTYFIYWDDNGKVEKLNEKISTLPENIIKYFWEQVKFCLEATIVYTKKELDTYSLFKDRVLSYTIGENNICREIIIKDSENSCYKVEVGLAEVI